jgi:hypothetical protein
MKQEKPNGSAWDRSKLACPESIAHLWGYPDGPVAKPSTETLFQAIIGEAFACLHYSDWEPRIRRIENILTVIKWRIDQFQSDQRWTELDKLMEKAKGGDGRA